MLPGKIFSGSDDLRVGLSFSFKKNFPSSFNYRFVLLLTALAGAVETGSYVARTSLEHLSLPLFPNAGITGMLHQALWGILNVISPHKFIGSGTTRRCDFVGMALLEEVQHCRGGL